jgi:hypothetical protein
MESVFQQAEFDKKLDTEKIKNANKKVLQIMKNFLAHKDKCNYCGKYGWCISEPLTLSCKCEMCLTIEELEREEKQNV